MVIRGYIYLGVLGYRGFGVYGFGGRGLGLRCTP